MLLAIFLALAGTASAKVMESLHHVPDGWRQIGEAQNHDRIHLRIAMSAPNPGLFEQTLYSISDPAHPRYAQYLKRDELKAMLRPKDKATEAVLAWLVKSGVDRSAIAQDGEWINFVCTVGAANDLLDTSFGVFEDVDGQKLLRTLNYSVPDKVCEYVKHR